MRPAERQVIPFPDRQPPCAPEAEISVLGSMLIDETAVGKALELVDDGMFYAEKHRRVFRSMLRLFQRAEPIEPVTLREDLSKSGDLELVGGLDFISELLEAVPTAANIVYHARIVRDRAQLRRLIEAGTHIVRIGFESTDRTISETVDIATQVMFEAVRDTTAGGLRWIKHDLYPAFERIEQLQAAKGGLTGLSTGLLDLDELTGGMQKGDLICIGARPSMGKTALVTGLALQCGISEGKPVAVFSCEMSRQQLIQRMLCYEARVNLSNLLRGRLTDDDYVRLAQAAGHLNSAQIYIDDTGDLSVTQLRSRARQLKSEFPDLALIIVDYVQLMNAPDRENRTQEISAISRGLKSSAKEIDVPLIALSQLSRKVEDRADKRPQLSDLRESGSLEQDSDIVSLLYRPEYYFGAERKHGRGKDAKTEDLRGKAELIVAKHRNGPTDTVRLYFKKEYTRFENWSNAG
jgi:replicative DNA helicase